MNRNPLAIRRLIALAILGWLPLPSTQAADVGSMPSSSKPNIIIILADDLGYGSLGCYGATKVKTPNLDKLATEGRRFTDAHSTSSVCTPSRYSLLTGQYAWRINNWEPVFCHAPLLIDPAKTTTIASLLKRQGYATACIGKWHLGFGKGTPDWNGELNPGPLEVGFDYYYGIPEASSHPPFVYVENHRVVGLDPADPLVFKSGSITYCEGGKAAQYTPTELGPKLTDKAISWLRQQHPDKPFFLYYATPLVHLPITPAPKYLGTSECGPYGDYIQEFDAEVGQLLATLDQLKLTDKTLVIFTSDNGAMMKARSQYEGSAGPQADGLAAWQAGLRADGNLLGFKFDAWEGGHREPFIARWPGHIPAGSTSNQLIGLVDLLGTISAVVGESLAAHEGVDSFNMLPALIGNPDKPIRDHLLSAAPTPATLALRQGQWLYINAQGSGGGKESLEVIALTHEVNSDITPDGKIKPDAPKTQLYDLAADEAETTNVVLQHPEVAQELKIRLEQIIKSKRTAPLSGTSQLP